MMTPSHEVPLFLPSDQGRHTIWETMTKTSGIRDPDWLDRWYPPEPKLELQSYSNPANGCVHESGFEYRGVSGTLSNEVDEPLLVSLKKRQVCYDPPKIDNQQSIYSITTRHHFNQTDDQFVTKGQRDDNESMSMLHKIAQNISSGDNSWNKESAWIRFSEKSFSQEKVEKPRETVLASPRNVEGALASPFYDPDFWVPRRPLAPNRVYHFHVIYNHAQSHLGRSRDTDLALMVTTSLVEKLELRGYVNGYYNDRDRRCNNSLCTELGRVISGASLTILLLTPGFLRDCLETYLQVGAFRDLLTQPSSRAGQLIIVGVGVSQASLPHILGRHDVLFFKEEDWEADHSTWTRLDDMLLRSLGRSCQGSAQNPPAHQGIVMEEVLLRKKQNNCSVSKYLRDHVAVTDHYGMGIASSKNIPKMQSEQREYVSAYDATREVEESSKYELSQTIDEVLPVFNSDEANAPLSNEALLVESVDCFYENTDCVRKPNKENISLKNNDATTMSRHETEMNAPTECVHNVGFNAAQRKYFGSASAKYFRLTEALLLADVYHDMGQEYVAWDPGGSTVSLPGGALSEVQDDSEDDNESDESSDVDSDDTVLNNTLESTDLEGMRVRYGSESLEAGVFEDESSFNNLDNVTLELLSARSDSSVNTLDTIGLDGLRGRYGFERLNRWEPYDDLQEGLLYDDLDDELVCLPVEQDGNTFVERESLGFVYEGYDDDETLLKSQTPLCFANESNDQVVHSLYKDMHILLQEVDGEIVAPLENTRYNSRQDLVQRVLRTGEQEAAPPIHERQPPDRTQVVFSCDNHDDRIMRDTDLNENALDSFKTPTIAELWVKWVEFSSEDMDVFSSSEAGCNTNNKCESSEEKSKDRVKSSLSQTRSDESQSKAYINIETMQTKRGIQNIEIHSEHTPSCQFGAHEKYSSENIYHDKNKEVENIESESNTLEMHSVDSTPEIAIQITKSAEHQANQGLYKSALEDSTKQTNCGGQTKSAPNSDICTTYLPLESDRSRSLEALNEAIKDAVISAVGATPHDLQDVNPQPKFEEEEELKVMEAYDKHVIVTDSPVRTVVLREEPNDALKETVKEQKESNLFVEDKEAAQLVSHVKDHLNEVVDSQTQGSSRGTVIKPAESEKELRNSVKDSSELLNVSEETNIQNNCHKTCDDTTNIARVQTGESTYELNDEVEIEATTRTRENCNENTIAMNKQEQSLGRRMEIPHNPTDMSKPIGKTEITLEMQHIGEFTINQPISDIKKEAEHASVHASDSFKDASTTCPMEDAHVERFQNAQPNEFCIIVIDSSDAKKERNATKTRVMQSRQAMEQTSHKCSHKHPNYAENPNSEMSLENREVGIDTTQYAKSNAEICSAPSFTNIVALGLAHEMLTHMVADKNLQNAEKIRQKTTNAEGNLNPVANKELKPVESEENPFIVKRASLNIDTLTGSSSSALETTPTETEFDKHSLPKNSIPGCSEGSSVDACGLPLRLTSEENDIKEKVFTRSVTKEEQSASLVCADQLNASDDVISSLDARKENYSSPAVSEPRLDSLLGTDCTNVVTEEVSLPETIEAENGSCLAYMVRPAYGYISGASEIEKGHAPNRTIHTSENSEAPCCDSAMEYQKLSDYKNHETARWSNDYENHVRTIHIPNEAREDDGGENGLHEKVDEMPRVFDTLIQTPIDLESETIYYSISQEEDMQSVAQAIVKDVLLSSLGRVNISESEKGDDREVMVSNKPLTEGQLTSDMIRETLQGSTELVDIRGMVPVVSADPMVDTKYCGNTEHVLTAYQDNIKESMKKSFGENNEQHLKIDLESDQLFSETQFVHASSPRLHHDYEYQSKLEQTHSTNISFSDDLSSNNVTEYDSMPYLSINMHHESNRRERNDQRDAYSDEQTLHENFSFLPNVFDIVPEENDKNEMNVKQREYPVNFGVYSPRSLPYNEGDSGFFDPCDSMASRDEVEIHLDARSHGLERLDEHAESAISLPVSRNGNDETMRLDTERMIVVQASSDVHVSHLIDETTHKACPKPGQDMDTSEPNTLPTNLKLARDECLYLPSATQDTTGFDNESSETVLETRAREETGIHLVSTGLEERVNSSTEAESFRFRTRTAVKGSGTTEDMATGNSQVAFRGASFSAEDVGSYCRASASLFSPEDTADDLQHVNLALHESVTDEGAAEDTETVEIGGRETLSIYPGLGESLSPRLWSPRFLTPRSRSNFERLRAMHRQVHGLSPEGLLPGGIRRGGQSEAGDMAERNSGEEAGSGTTVAAAELDSAVAQENDQQKKTSWWLQVYKGVCHSLSKPDMPYMG